MLQRNLPLPQIFVDPIFSYSNPQIFPPHKYSNPQIFPPHKYSYTPTADATEKWVTYYDLENSSGNNDGYTAPNAENKYCIKAGNKSRKLEKRELKRVHKRFEEKRREVLANQQEGGLVQNQQQEDNIKELANLENLEQKIVQFIQDKWKKARETWMKKQIDFENNHSRENGGNGW
jgi:hypothetical protein